MTLNEFCNKTESPPFSFGVKVENMLTSSYSSHR
jgi:hypothetical protein